MSARSPSFQFYASDFLSDINVASMTFEERGVYITALCHAWLEGGIPADEEELVRLFPGADRSAIARVSRCFSPAIANPSLLVNLRLEQERDKQVEWREKMSRAGQVGNEKRWKSNKSNRNSGKSEVAASVAPVIAQRLPSDLSAIAQDRFSTFVFQSSNVMNVGKNEASDTEELNRDQNGKDKDHLTPGSGPLSGSAMVCAYSENETEGLSASVERIMRNAEELTGQKIRNDQRAKQAEKVFPVLKEHTESDILAAMAAAMQKQFWSKRILGTEDEGQEVSYPTARLLSNLSVIMNERNRVKWVKKPKANPTAATNPYLAAAEMDFCCWLCEEGFTGNAREMEQHMKEKHPDEPVIVDGVLRG
jgi:uncharacterized protein YdaU (DUF1376 family)